MKYRKDFVTNSSSSSFIVHFKNKEDLEKKYDEFLKKYGEELAKRVFHDIRTHKMTYNEVLKYYKEHIKWQIRYRLIYETDEYANKGVDWRYSDEFEKLLKVEVKKAIKEFEETVYHRGKFAVVNYCDHDEIGSKLEHRIMPYASFVAESFNLH